MECLQCGRCCPDTCEHKLDENGVVVCAIHPSITGDDRRDESLGLMCHFDPDKYYVAGIACWAVIESIGRKDVEVVTLPNGQVVRKDYWE